MDAPKVPARPPKRCHKHRRAASVPTTDTTETLSNCKSETTRKWTVHANPAESRGTSARSGSMQPIPSRALFTFCTVPWVTNDPVGTCSQTRAIAHCAEQRPRNRQFALSNSPSAARLTHLVTHAYPASAYLAGLLASATSSVDMARTTSYRRLARVETQLILLGHGQSRPPPGFDPGKGPTGFPCAARASLPTLPNRLISHRVIDCNNYLCHTRQVIESSDVGAGVTVGSEPRPKRGRQRVQKELEFKQDMPVNAAVAACEEESRHMRKALARSRGVSRGNHHTYTIQAWMEHRWNTGAPWLEYLHRVATGKISEATIDHRIRCIEILLDRRWGRPATHLDLTAGDGNESVTITINRTAAAPTTIDVTPQRGENAKLIAETAPAHGNDSPQPDAGE